MKRLFFFLTVSVIMTQCANTEKTKKLKVFQDGGYMGKENIFLKTRNL